MKTIIILPANGKSGFEKLDAQSKKPQRNEVLDFVKMVLSALKYVLIIVLPFILLLAACNMLQAQTKIGGAKFKLEGFSINTNTQTTIYSDYGTDFYRINEKNEKVYVSLSNLDKARISPITPEITEVMPKQMNRHYVNTMQRLKPVVLPSQIKVHTIKVTAKKTIIVRHYENTTPTCQDYLTALNDTNVIIIDSIMIADKANKADYAMLLQEIKQTNKTIAYQSKILNKANLGLQSEINGFAAIVYNDCHKRPTVFGYLGAYPIYKLCLGVRNLGFKIMKLGRAKKLKKLQAAKKQLLQEKKTYAKL